MFYFLLQIVYSLSSYETQRYGETFDVNPVTGALSIKQNLDYESTQSYTLTIEARDMGPNSIAGQCTVEIHVTDENDNAPEITVNNYDSSADANTVNIKGKFIIFLIEAWINRH